MAQEFRVISGMAENSSNHILPLYFFVPQRATWHTGRILGDLCPEVPERISASISMYSAEGHFSTGFPRTAS
jgi:hypothetical protein